MMNQLFQQLPQVNYIGLFGLAVAASSLLAGACYGVYLRLVPQKDPKTAAKPVGRRSSSLRNRIRPDDLGQLVDRLESLEAALLQKDVEFRQLRKETESLKKKMGNKRPNQKPQREQHQTTTQKDCLLDEEEVIVKVNIQVDTITSRAE